MPGDNHLCPVNADNSVGNVRVSRLEFGREVPWPRTARDVTYVNGDRVGAGLPSALLQSTALLSGFGLGRLKHIGQLFGFGDLFGAQEFCELRSVLLGFPVPLRGRQDRPFERFLAVAFEHKLIHTKLGAGSLFGD